MSLATRKRRSAARQMLDLARRRGDGGVALLPGVSQSGMHWLARDCGLGVSLTPTAGTLGPDSVTRPSAAWLAAYVESTASTPAAVDGPVGFLSDGEGTLGANLVTNPGPFGNTTGWGAYYSTIAAQSGELVSTATATTGNGSQFDLTLTANSTYKITAVVRNISSTNVSILLQRGAAGSYAAIYQSQSYTSSSATQISFVVTATATDAQICLRGAVSAVGQQIALVSISVQPLSGRHATQGTGANKPVMRRGVTNLLSQSNTFTNAAWSQVNATPTAGTADPFGGTAASTLAVLGGGYIRQNLAFPAGAPGTIPLWVRKSSSGGATNIRLTTNNTAAWNTGISQQIALTSQWQLVLATGVIQTGGTNAYVIIGGVDTAGNADATCTGNVDIYCAGLFTGTLTAAQILAAGGIPLTTTIAASSSGGNYALEFGGSVTQLQASFAPTNAATVVLAVRVNSFAGTPVLVGQAAGGLQVYINSGGGVQAGIAGGTNFGSANGVITAGAVYVISVRIAVNGTSTIRVNGVVVATSTAITAAMNQTTISIGSNGSSNFTGGLFGPVLLYTSVLSDAETLVLERGAGALAPITGVKF